MNRWILHWHRNLVVVLLRLLLLWLLLLWVTRMRAPANSLVLRRLNFAHGWWRIDMW